VIEADADLQDALVEITNRIRFADPDYLQRLVLLEELASIELLDALQEFGRRWTLAAGGAAGWSLLDALRHSAQGI
jgi:hypothetical protein